VTSRVTRAGVFFLDPHPHPAVAPEHALRRHERSRNGQPLALLSTTMCQLS
jgi:hypothetical protein